MRTSPSGSSLSLAAPAGRRAAPLRLRSGGGSGASWTGFPGSGASLVCEREGAAVAPPEPTSPGPDVSRGARAPADPLPLPLLTLRRGISPDEMEAAMLYGRRLGDIGRRIISFNLLQMQETRAFQRLGHASIYTYARGKLHLSKRRCREYLATARALEELHAVDAALHAGHLTWSQVVLIARRATPTCEAEWIEAARARTYEQLELAVKTTAAGKPPRKPGDRKGLPEIRFPMEFQLDPVTHARWEAARAKLSAECGTPIDNLTMLSILLDLILSMDATGQVPGRKRVPGSQFRVVLRQEPGGGLSVETSEGLVPLEGFPALLAAVLAEAEVSAPDAPHAGEQGAEPGTGLGNAPTPAWLRQLVLERDGVRCRHCSARTDLNAHHIHFREDGGPTVASNLVALCLRCHGLVHAKLLEAVGSHGASVTFRAVHQPALDAVALATASAPAYGLPPVEVPAEGGGGVPPLAGEGGGVPPRGVLLQDVPARVDATWWQRHTPALTVVGGARGTGAAWMLGRDIAPLPAATGGEGAAESRRGAEAAEPRRADAFAGLHGLERTCQQLEAHATWAESLGEPFPHTLLMGPAGTGKSLLARRVAQRAGGKLVVGFGGMLSSPSALPGLLSQLCAGDVLFLDELHAVPRSVLEGLYLAMTDRELPLTLQQGGATAAITLEVAPFTLVAATTDEACVPPAMASRFVVQERIGYYLPHALAAIARDAAAAHGVALEHDAALAIAAASRGTPREAKRLVTNVLATRMSERGDAIPDAAAPLDLRATRWALEQLGYEPSGLSPDQCRYLGVLQQQRGVIALSRAAALAGIPAKTVYDDVEPDLVARGLVEVTPHGRRLVRGA